MSTKDRVGFIALGLLIWAAGTSVYRLSGSSFFEGSATGYWLNVGFTGILYAVVSLGVMKWRKIKQKDWLQGAICIALPGMLGEVPILVQYFHDFGTQVPLNFGTPQIRPFTSRDQQV